MLTRDTFETVIPLPLTDTVGGSEQPSGAVEKFVPESVTFTVVPGMLPPGAMDVSVGVAGTVVRASVRILFPPCSAI